MTSLHELWSKCLAHKKIPEEPAGSETDKPAETEGSMAGLKEAAAQRGVLFLAPDDEAARELSGLSYGEITERLGVTTVGSTGCSGYPLSKLETSEEKRQRKRKYELAVARLARRA